MRLLFAFRLSGCRKSDLKLEAIGVLDIAMDTTAPLIDDRFVFIEVAVFYNTITILYKDIEVQEGKHGKPFFGVYIYMYYSTKDGYYIYIY